MFDDSLYNVMVVALLRNFPCLLIGLSIFLYNADACAQEAAVKPSGRWIRQIWYQAGLEHGNPRPEGRRIRVNAPETMLDPRFGKRIEARGNGMIQILATDSLHLLRGANLYLELWGGHPGTMNKRVTVNGRSTYQIPEVGTADMHCTYHYPVIPLKITDLVNGYNVFQFACDKGASFWGHFLVDNAALELELDDEHPDLSGENLNGFTASVVPSVRDEFIELKLQTDHGDMSKVSRVEYFGFYKGFDENGNNIEPDWHGYTKDKASQYILGASRRAPFDFIWNTTMIPDQSGVKVKAVVYFKTVQDLFYETSPSDDLTLPRRKNASVRIFSSTDLPAPFVSRASKLKTCTIPVDTDPSDIERAEIHVVIWDGGEGTIADHFTFNGKPFRVASGKHLHDVIYKVIELDPAIIRSENKIELLSDTEHHGIEVLLPGPVLVIRARGKGK